MATKMIDPDALAAEAAELAAAAREKQEKAEQQRAEIAAARAEQADAYWRDRLIAFYQEGRQRFNAAWQAFAEAVPTGDASSVLGAWLAFVKVRAEVRAEGAMVLDQADRRGLTGDSRPRVSGLDDPRRATLSAALDLVTGQIEDQAHAARAAELRDQADAAEADAETTVRAGKGKPNAATVAPAGVFLSARYPNLTAGGVKFHDGRAVVYDPHAAAELRAGIAAGRLDGVTEAESA